ncbi:MAG: site-specific DNA-methyltransferase [Oscillospiraceae bacterium]|nr:site-specific DNA-methyltransferase [Oscillospiraceae bacterium]
MENYKIEIRRVHISELIPAEYNPRVDLKPGTHMYERLLLSIEQFGYVDPIVWNERTKHVVGGHQRLKILKERGAENIDVAVINCDPDREKALNLTLNKATGDWEIPKLVSLLKNIEDTGLELNLTGFTLKEVDKLYSQAARQKGNLSEDDFDVDEVTEIIEIPVTQLGDIWLINGHRLMCGDSTKPADVLRLMGGNKAKFCFADPPWNVKYGSTSHPNWKTGEDRTILNDDMSSEDFYHFLLAAFKNMASVCELGTPIYIAMSAQEWHNVHRALLESKFHWSSTIIWYKDAFVLSRKDYHTQYEPLWYGWLSGAARLCEVHDRQQSDVWEIKRPKKSKEHPTMKPIALVGKAINNSSRKGDFVVDLFGGSGTTLLACEQTERVAYLMELSPKYCDVIVERCRNFLQSDSNIFLLRDGVKYSFDEVPKPPKPEPLEPSETME